MTRFLKKERVGGIKKKKINYIVKRKIDLKIVRY